LLNEAPPDGKAACNGSLSKVFAVMLDSAIRTAVDLTLQPAGFASLCTSSWLRSAARTRSKQAALQ
jgi:hypothetical protein